MLEEGREGRDSRAGGAGSPSEKELKERRWLLPAREGLAEGVRGESGTAKGSPMSCRTVSEAAKASAI